MNDRRRLCALSTCAISMAVMISVGGCGGFSLSSSSPPRPTLNLATLGIGDDSTYFEAFENNLFDDAEFVELDGEPRVIRGRVSGDGDVDLYDLGPASKGTRIVIEMTGADSLDGALALFDGAGSALLVNDHRNTFLGRRDPFINVVMREDSEACYLAVSATPGYSAIGNYALLASKEVPVPIPSVRPDTVLLMFNGGSNVKIGQRAAMEVSPFDPSDIDGIYAGQASAMTGQIVARIRADYEGFDLTILSTSEGDLFDGSMTRLFFGTYDPGLLGVAEGVDEFNSATAQEAIVFTDTFAAFLPLEPSVEEMSQAIANVATHEIGHLLGLIHTSDSEGIMDVTASLGQLLANQTFRTSPLYADVFPIGDQNAVQSLLYSVGGDPEIVAAKALTSYEPAREKHGAASKQPARKSFMLSSCGLQDHER